MNKVKDLVSKLVVLSLCVIICTSIGIRLNLIDSFFGYNAWVVRTQSMRPIIQPGDLIVSSSRERTTFSKGDIVVFETEEGNVLTHRIVSKEGVKYQTQGDANNTEDNGTIEEKKIKGKQIIRVPFLGKILLFIQSVSGIIFIIILVLIVWILKKLVCLVNHKEEQYKNEKYI